MCKKVLSIIIIIALAFGGLNITNVEAASTLKLNKKVTFVRIGKPLKLKVKNSKKKVKWKSSNKKIATVSKKGVVKGKKSGECDIIAKAGKKKAKCHIVVTHKIAKKITKKLMKKVAKAIKKKGKFDSSENCYVYRKRFVEKDGVYLGALKYYPKNNYFAININDDRMKCDVEFHVGDKNTCKYDAVSYEHGVYMKGLYNKKKPGDEYSSITITDSNLASQFVSYAKQYVHSYVQYQISMLEQILIELKTNIHSEDLGFKWTLNDYLGDDYIIE